jgi:toxin ParE1/3/4
MNADRQFERIEKEILSLSEMPERYKALDLDFEVAKTVRMVTVDRYCVIYHVAKERGAVQILRILYGGRDIPAELEKDIDNRDGSV